MSRSETLADVIRNGARRHPDHLAITAAERDVTYAQLDDASNRGAQLLRSLGVEHQHRIAFLSRNCVEYFEAMFAAAKLGAVMVPLNWRLASTEVASVVDDAGPMLTAFAEADLLDLVADCDERLLSGIRLLLFGDVRAGQRRSEFVDAQLSTSFRRPRTPRVPRRRDVAALHLGHHRQSEGRHADAPQPCFDIIESLAAEWHFDPGCVVYVPYPSFHAVGTAWPVLNLYRGGTVVLRRSFDPTQLHPVGRGVRRHPHDDGAGGAADGPETGRGVESANMSSLQPHRLWGGTDLADEFWGVPSTCCRSAASTHAYGLAEATGTVGEVQLGRAPTPEPSV